ncbi:hypothetical protein Adi01nite_27080 [Amorphoplanes digitatis]|nr:hypothetical protein Adi01nite_27080 [Actinoplanes digitatis]
MALDQGLAADGLLGRHVVLDDGAEHFELAIVETHAEPLPAVFGTPPFGTPQSRVPVYVAATPRAMISHRCSRRLADCLFSALARHVALATFDLRSYRVRHD